MERSEIESKVISYLHTIFGADLNITAETRLNEDLAAKSMQMISILACIEEEIGVEVTLPEAINSATVNDLVDKVVEHL